MTTGSLEKVRMAATTGEIQPEGEPGVRTDSMRPREARAAAGPTPYRGTGVRAWLARRPWRERSFWLSYSAFYGVIGLIAVSSFLSPYFLTTENLLNVLRQWSMVALIIVGMTFVIINRGIDVSGGSRRHRGCGANGRRAWLRDWAPRPAGQRQADSSAGRVNRE